MNVKDVEKFFKEWGSICRLLTKKDKAIYSQKELLDFAEQYHKSKVNNGVLDGVSSEAELLLSFCYWINKEYKLNIPPDLSDVNRYLETK